MRHAWLTIPTVLALLSCGGGIPIPQDCRLFGCEAGNACVEIEGGTWECRPVEPPPCTTGSCPRDVESPKACNTETKKCEACLDLGDAIWNTAAGDVTCSTPARPVKHWPPTEECPELTVACENPLPQPQCKAEDECNCWRGLVRIQCPGPPPIGDCTLGTPTARSLFDQGKRVEIRPKKEGAKGMSATPLGEFGPAYYCQEGLWPEACAAGRTFGPVAPDGHPNRVACEQVFLEECGPVLSQAVCLSPVGDCPITFDPFIVINGLNQNHPRNVRQGCGTQLEDHASWKKELIAGGLKVVEGAMPWSTAHGNGRVKACNGDASVCTVSTFVIDQ